jgi:hypothetical protein
MAFSLELIAVPGVIGAIITHRPVKYFEKALTYAAGAAWAVFERQEILKLSSPRFAISDDRFMFKIPHSAFRTPHSSTPTIGSKGSQ